MTTTTIAPHSHGVPQLLTSGLRSYEPGDFEPVSVRQESWRFTPVDVLGPLLSAPNGNVAVDFDKRLSADGITIETSIADGEPISGYVPTDRLAANIWKFAGTVTTITVKRGSVAATPISLRLSSEGAAACSVVLVNVEEQAEASIIIEHEGFVALGSTIVVNLADAAVADVTLVQNIDGPTAVYAHHILGRDAVLKSSVISLGGSCVRVVPTVAYAAPGGDAVLNGIAIAGPGDHIEHRSLANHEVPNCRSNVAYKNLLSGTSDNPSRTVWIGDVIIHAAALGTDTYEMNRNLVIGDHARADSVPNLEIETGEIAGAGHASATGRLDDEHVFYLQSRGISEIEAKRLIVRGFFEDLLGQMPHESVANAVRDRLEGLLG